MRIYFLLLACFLGQSIFAQDSAKVAPKNSKIAYGIASWYSDSFDGRKTSNGEIFRQSKLTCATHNGYKFGTWLRVTNMRNGKVVIVKVNDRMHPRMKRIVDLSRAAAKELGILSRGLTKVKVEILGKHKPTE
jgi:rare lipoprotein A